MVHLIYYHLLGRSPWVAKSLLCEQDFNFDHYEHKKTSDHKDFIL